MDVYTVTSRPGVTPLAELLDLLDHRPDWHADAACREAPPHVSWFPGRGGDLTAAKDICAGCLALDDCRSWALEQGPDLIGVWGGLTPAGRQQLRGG